MFWVRQPVKDAHGMSSVYKEINTAKVNNEKSETSEICSTCNTFFNPMG